MTYRDPNSVSIGERREERFLRTSHDTEPGAAVWQRQRDKRLPGNSGCDERRDRRDRQHIACFQCTPAECVPCG